jgi:uncharacterized spore protein YtfJ
MGFGGSHPVYLADLLADKEITIGVTIMTDEINLEPEVEESEMTDSEFAIETLRDTLDTFLSAASVDAVYGQPIEKDDTLIVPTAEVIAGLGFGVGTGYGRSSKENRQGGGGDGSGGGGGGGGRVFSRPVAVIIASPEGVRVEPVFDITKIILAGLTAGAFMMGMILRMRNPKKALEALKDSDFG